MSGSPAPAPENRPAPLEALLLPETPAEQHYRRNHFPYPAVDPSAWRLEVAGAVERPLRLDAAGLRELPRRELRVVLECAGHRRTEHDPPVAGVPWKTGALSQARWAGAPLALLLERAGLRPDAVEVVLHGADRGPFAGMEGTHAFARSLPLEKAHHPDTLLAWEMNGGPLPEAHGAPLRAVVPGWYAMDSVKWLTRIEVVTEPFRGVFQEHDYRFLPEGASGPGERLAAVPVSSLIVSPGEEERVPPGRRAIRGIAWGGEGGVRAVEFRVDDGPWRPASLRPAGGPYERLLWEAEYDAPARDHLLAARAVDAAGREQPERPVWNRKGYANNSVHRVCVRAES